MSSVQKGYVGLTSFVILSGSFISGAIIASLGPQVDIGVAQADAIEIPAAGSGQAVQVLGTGEFMKIMMAPQYVKLREAVENEPTDREGWRNLYIAALPLAETFNLLYSRSDEGFQSTPEWTEQVDHSMSAALTLSRSIKDKADYAAIKNNYLAVVASCNDCHNQFEPGEVDTIEEPLSWREAAADQN